MEKKSYELEMRRRLLEKEFVEMEKKNQKEISRLEKECYVINDIIYSITIHYFI